MVEQGAARGRESRFRAPTNSGAPHLGGVGGDRHRGPRGGAGGGGERRFHCRPGC